MNTENPNLDEQTKQVIFTTISENLTTIYVVWLSTKIKGFTKWYLLISYLLVAYGINFMNLPLLYLFLPIALLIGFVLIYFLDMYLILQSFVKIQLALIHQHNLNYDLETLSRLFALYCDEKKIYS